MWFMNGTQVSSAADVGNVGTAWSVVGTGDFDADGNSDIAWRDASGDIAIWLMQGSTVASTGGLGNVPTTWMMAQTGDFDGGSDLLWSDTAGGTAISFMKGLSDRQSRQRSHQLVAADRELRLKALRGTLGGTGSRAIAPVSLGAMQTGDNGWRARR
jgi:hypothetical protein